MTVLTLFKRSRRDERQATIAQTGKQFATPGKDSILREALAAGVAFPHSCTVGTCGTCKAKLISGKVREITDSALVLTTPELKEGYILPCQAVAKCSVELDVAGMADLPDHPLRELAGVVTGQELVTPDIVRLTVELEDHLEFSAGQYAELQFGEFSGPRSYSFADAPSDVDGNSLSFFVRLVPGGEFTSWLFEADRCGSGLTVLGPLGNLWLRPRDVPILCVAGGSGLAPIKGILEEATHGDAVTRDVVVVFGARTQADLYCVTELEAVAAAWKGSFSLRLILSEEAADSGWTGERGFVTDVVASLPEEFLRTCDVYTCGPPPMIDALEETVYLHRSDAGFFHADRFVTRSGH